MVPPLGIMLKFNMTLIWKISFQVRKCICGVPKFIIVISNRSIIYVCSFRSLFWYCEFLTVWTIMNLIVHTIYIQISFIWKQIFSTSSSRIFFSFKYYQMRCYALMFNRCYLAHSMCAEHSNLWAEINLGCGMSLNANKNKTFTFGDWHSSRSNVLWYSFIYT